MFLVNKGPPEEKRGSDTLSCPLGFGGKVCKESDLNRAGSGHVAGQPRTSERDASAQARRVAAAFSVSLRHPVAVARSRCQAGAARSGRSNRPTRRPAMARGPSTPEGRHSMPVPRPPQKSCPQAVQRAAAAWPGGRSTACLRHAGRNPGSGCRPGAPGPLRPRTARARRAAGP